MAKIIECVPNFSEGRDKDVIDAISQAIAETEGCSLLDIDPGSSTNRTVYTFVGSPEAVVEGALNAARTAFQLIDMRRHKGEHPRLGAMDVCPFVPVRNATMDDCVECANNFGKRAAEGLGIPVYLYGFAAKEDYRKTVPQIRAGEYEGLSIKIKKEEWKPNYGSAEFLPTWGATMAGARKFLIAYNINVLGTKEQAHRIALNLREQGRGPNQPGRLKLTQGMGWYLQEANLAQISLNLLDFEETAIHTAFEEANKDARDLKVGICGSEVVGLVPLQAILMAAEYYIEKENLFIISEEQKVRLAIERLGLSSIKPFQPKERIIEYMVDSGDDGPLISLSLRQFIYALGSRCSTPGGGSASAAIAAMGSALGLMVGWLTFGNKKFEKLDSTMRKAIPPLHDVMMALIPMVDADTDAFTEYMAAMKLSHKTPEEEERRNTAMQNGLKTAIRVPLKVMSIANRSWESLIEVAKVGNFTALSDLRVGAKSLETGVYGAYSNVMINLRDLKDEKFLSEVKAEAESHLRLAQEKCSEIVKILDGREE